MSDKQDAKPIEDVELKPTIMPGAEPMDQPENIDLNFDLAEEPEETAEESEVAEEAAEETEVEEEATDKVEEPEAELEKQEEEVEEPEVEPEKQAVKPKKPKKPMVPKARLDQALTRQKELQRKVDEYSKKEEKVSESAPVFDFNKAETEYQEALLDGKQENASKLRNEIRNAERDLLRHEMREEMANEIGANRELTSIQETAAEIEAEYVAFDQNHEDFNAEYAQEVVAIRDGLMSHNMAGPEALKKAALMVVQTYDLKGVTSTESALTSKKAHMVDEVARKRKQVSQKLKAAEAQPPELPGESSAQHGEKSLEELNNMSEDEFNALPDATIARLRGDFL